MTVAKRRSGPLCSKVIPLLRAPPRQRLERSRRIFLNIPLITGEKLVFDPDVREFRVQ